MAFRVVCRETRWMGSVPYDAGSFVPQGQPEDGFPTYETAKAFAEAFGEPWYSRYRYAVETIDAAREVSRG